MKRAVVVAVAFACGGSHGPTTVATQSIHETSSATDARDTAPTEAAAREDDSAIPGWYELQPLLADLRPEAIASARAGALAELPLYDFDVRVEPSESRFRLDERFFFQNDSAVPLTDVVLRMFADTPNDGEPPEKLTAGHCVDTPCTVTTLGRDGIVVHPTMPLAVGKRLRVVLHVSGKLRTIDPSRTTMMAAASSSMKTIFPMLGGEDNDPKDYGLLASGDDILSFGNFYPVLARHEGNTWDVDQGTLGDIGPDALAHVHAHIDLPAGYVVAASGSVEHEEVKDGRRRIDVAAGCMRDFAMLASEKFVSSEKDVDGVKVRSFFRASDRPTGDRVLDVAAWSFGDFQKRFGPYPYRKLDLVEEALVSGAGGVEFAGLATVASMFYKPSGTPSGGGGLDALLGMLMGSGSADGPMKAGAAEFTTAHEVGHMWWHEAVGSDSRKHPWQDEALAQFSAMLYAEDRYGAARAKREADMNAKSAYEMMRLLGQSDGPVDVPAGNQSQMVYGGLVYGKGPYYLVALRKTLGDGAFFGALREYVKQYYLGFAPNDALAVAMEATQSSKKAQIAALTHRWLSEAHGDDDLGKASFDSLLSMASGGQSSAALGAAGGSDVQQLIKMLDALGGGGGLGGLDMQKMMKMLAP